MSAHEDHTSRADYAGAVGALVDARQVLTDLLALGEGQTVVPVAEFEFLARRARVLVLACIESELSR